MIQLDICAEEKWLDAWQVETSGESKHMNRTREKQEPSLEPGDYEITLPQRKIQLLLWEPRSLRAYTHKKVIS